MGGLLHMFEFNQGRMAKKIHAHKNNNDDMETSGNGMKLQVETSQVHCAEGELQYSCQVEDGWSKKISHSNVDSVKKANKEGFSKQSGARSNAPSLVARLMGIDTMPLPLDTKSVVPLDESTHENMERKFSKKKMNGKGWFGRGSSNLNSFSHMEFDSFYQHIDDDDEDDEGGHSFGEPEPREHPQEEELQKFKKDFEEYQSTRFKEWPKAVDIGSGSRRMLSLSQENLSKENMQHISSSKTDSHSFKKKESFPSRSKTQSRDFEESLMMKSKSRLLDICTSPTQIVILKPGSERICNCNHEENFKSLHRRKGIEDFLEEVRERLKCELQGIRASGIETPFNDKSDAKEVRESMTRDAEPNLLRSESTRSYKSKMQLNGQSSPEFFNIDTRRFLSERLRNTVKNELHLDIPEVACYLENDRVRLKQDTIKGPDDKSQWGVLKEKKELQTCSNRHKLDDNVFLHKELSPRNLERSLSAPASGASFGRLLLEDRHILTGALIQRKLEAVEARPVGAKKQKKDGLNIKEKLSNFKYTLGLRRKLFGKRIMSKVESHGSEYGEILRDARSGPTILMKYGGRHENSTEVPPSPASVSSCADEEHWRQIGYSSLTSTPDASSLDDIFVPKIFRDISSGLNDLKRQLSELDSDGYVDFTRKQDPIESSLVELDGPEESYVRDLLVASGLYFGSWEKYIGNSVFEEVEESHRKLVKEDERSKKDDNKNKLEHKVLLDLLNEALSIVLGPPLTLSRFRRKLSNSSMQPPPCGKELLKLVWDIVRVSLHPTSNTSLYSVDSFLAQDLGSISWSGLTNDEIDTLERETACTIADDLVEEFTKDMLL
ncbi:uncharacterized protein LOC106765947 [Vigna radiata var. radiata]|uniref:Uncharacterized protein LOC106765947 n=1 Tax=Vigna radiata var. radiata TaxID=3916 RepID=A0A1S3UJI8_VIGRR|nr:uncharacterized protein LOC106765947 [Vigna radiata var. radiata]XP_022638574.1 uncharacterized protein LOC106765947 [Vigna radiata var. radiata]XP_022638575.1 uncharacterized protein LOC106765947 [Vigna radiata var. radiata]